LAMEQDAADGEVLNVGGGGSVSVKQVAEQLARLFGKDVPPLIERKFRKGDVRHCVGDITKIQAKLGYAPRVQFADGMRELIEWSRQAEAVDRFPEAARELAARGLA